LISLISYDLNHYYDKPRHETKDKDGNITTEQNYTQEKERIQNFLDKDLKNSVKNL
jgi:hypothetical protein